MVKRILAFFWFFVVISIFVFSIQYIKDETSQHNKQEIYNQWQHKYIVKTPQGIYINTSSHKENDVALSEAQGYGMLISVLNSQYKSSETQFYDFFTYYTHHCVNGTHLMSWRYINGLKKQKQDDLENNATDGDLYIAYALILASEKWPQHKAIYQTTATKILNNILTYNVNLHNNILTVGNWANQSSKYQNLMRTSDVLPSFFDKFYKFSKNSQWLLIKSKMIDSLYQASRNSKVGLVPDFVQVTNDNKVRSLTYDKNIKINEHDNDYYYNAFRVPYNLAINKNKSSKENKILTKMLIYFSSLQKISSGYTMSGKPINRFQSTSISAPLFYATSNSQKWRNLHQKQSFILDYGKLNHNYYDDTLLVLILSTKNN